MKAQLPRGWYNFGDNLSANERTMAKFYGK